MIEPPSLSSDQLQATAQRVLAGICRTTERGSDDKYYSFIDPQTERSFELRSSTGEDAQGRPAERFFMSEMVPNGRLCVYKGEQLLRTYEEPSIHALEDRCGPNGLMAAVRAAGIDPKLMVFTGGGYCRGAVYHDSLQACAEAIANALLTNTRYEYFKELSEQEKTRLAREDAVQSHAYFAREQQQLQQALDEPGIFKGCSGLMGPLSDDTKKRILAYLNAPSQSGWLELRGTMVTGHGTLWQAWCADDSNAPRSGDVGYPQREQLIVAIRSAVARREAQLAERLGSSHRSGLRSV